jgi:uncharacterized coiled-coil DUF342 family protein
MDDKVTIKMGTLEDITVRASEIRKERDQLRTELEQSKRDCENLRRQILELRNEIRSMERVAEYERGNGGGGNPGNW